MPEIIAVAALDRVCRDSIGSGSESSTEVRVKEHTVRDGSCQLMRDLVSCSLLSPL